MQMNVSSRTASKNAPREERAVSDGVRSIDDDYSGAPEPAAVIREVTQTVPYDPDGEGQGHHRELFAGKPWNTSPHGWDESEQPDYAE